MITQLTVISVISWVIMTFLVSHGNSLITPSLYFFNGKHCGGVPKSKQLEYIHKESKRSPVYKKREKKKGDRGRRGREEREGKRREERKTNPKENLQD
jgi:hypothetical protein